MRFLRHLFVLILGLLALPAFAQTPAPAPTPTPTPTIDPSLPRVAIETTAGRFVLALEAVKAPITTANFLRYVDQRKLDGVTFYRTAKTADHYGFVQFGVNGDPRRSLPPIKHEPTTLTGLSHTDGTISVARFAPGTARGDFTISLGDMSGSLDAHPGAPGDNLGYAAFGHVVEGMEVIDKIFDAPVSPTATVNGAFKGEVPLAPVKVLTARRAMQ